MRILSAILTSSRLFPFIPGYSRLFPRFFLIIFMGERQGATGNAEHSGVIAI
jgi:hypothetical protein